MAAPVVPSSAVGEQISLVPSYFPQYIPAAALGAGSPADTSALVKWINGFSP